MYDVCTDNTEISVTETKTKTFRKAQTIRRLNVLVENSMRTKTETFWQTAIVPKCTDMRLTSSAVATAVLLFVIARFY